MASYPKLLTTKATMLGVLTRDDIALVGLCYLFLGLIKVSGILSLLIIAFVLIGSSFLKRYLKKGFLKNSIDHLFNQTSLKKI
jgi:hypothetical protein